MNRTSKKKESKSPPNVWLIGPQCTGKTTLLEALRKHFEDEENCRLCDQYVEPPAIVEEVVRKVMREKNFNSTDVRDPERGLQLQVYNIQGQYTAEKELEKKWYISDRSALDALVYAETYLKSTDVASVTQLGDLAEWFILRNRMRNGVVVVCEAGEVEWLTSDEVRMAHDSAKEWVELTKRFYEKLDEEVIEYVVLPSDMKDLEQRIAFVKGALEARMRRDAGI